MENSEVKPPEEALDIKPVAFKNLVEALLLSIEEKAENSPGNSAGKQFRRASN